MQRRQHTAEIKTRVVLKALNGELTTAQIAKQYGVYPLMTTNRALVLRHRPEDPCRGVPTPFGLQEDTDPDRIGCRTVSLIVDDVDRLPTSYLGKSGHDAVY